MPTTRQYYTLGPAGRTLIEETVSNSGSEFHVAVGDVIRLGGKLRMFTLVNDCRGEHIGLTVSKTKVTFRKGFPDERTVDVNQRSVPEDCSTTLPREMLVKRLGPDAVQQFHAAKKDGSVDAWMNKHIGVPQTNEQTENETDMKKLTSSLPRRGGLAASVLADREAAAAKNAPAKATKTKGATKAKATKKNPDDTTHVTGKIFDCAIGGVLRALGKAGVTEEQATAILKKKGFKSSPITIKVNIRSGNGSGHNYGPPAKLTEAQLDELKALIA